MARLAAADGLLVVDKPIGPTSHDIVGQARRYFGTRQVGHAGTLDPMASGVLLLLFGEATKLAGYLTLDDKRYLATVTFGLETDTLDIQGTALRECELEPDWLGAATLEQAIRDEAGRTEQVPPAISAIRVGGERAYKATRDGRAPDLPPRSVRVHQLRVIARAECELELDLLVSKGYYVRSLARDLGERLGAPACLSQLRRVASGPFSIDEACAWPPAAKPELISVAQVARRCMSSFELTSDGQRRARLGQPLAASDFTAPPPADPSQTSAWLDDQGRLVALGRADEPGRYRVVRGFN